MKGNLPKSTWRSRFSYLESLLRETCWVCETTPQVLLQQLIDYKCLTLLATRQIVSKRFKSFQNADGAVKRHSDCRLDNPVHGNRAQRHHGSRTHRPRKTPPLPAGLVI